MECVCMLIALASFTVQAYSCKIIFIFWPKSKGATLDNSPPGEEKKENFTTLIRQMHKSMQTEQPCFALQ